MKMDIPAILYHATYEPYLPSIMRSGLGAEIPMKNWEDSEDGVVYLATESDVAVSYAETSDAVPEEYLDQIVVLAIDVEQLDLENIFIDGNVVDNDGATMEYHGIVPVSAITLCQNPNFKL
jgi:hypothetical protein